jgi:hypothetical protein
MPDFKGPGQWRTQAEKAQRGKLRFPTDAAAAPPVVASAEQPDAEADEARED